MNMPIRPRDSNQFTEISLNSSQRQTINGVKQGPGVGEQDKTIKQGPSFTKAWEYLKKGEFGNAVKALFDRLTLGGTSTSAKEQLVAQSALPKPQQILREFPSDYTSSRRSSARESLSNPTHELPPTPRMTYTSERIAASLPDTPDEVDRKMLASIKAPTHQPIEKEEEGPGGEIPLPLNLDELEGHSAPAPAPYQKLPGASNNYEQIWEPLGGPTNYTGMPSPPTSAYGNLPSDDHIADNPPVDQQEGARSRKPIDNSGYGNMPTGISNEYGPAPQLSETKREPPDLSKVGFGGPPVSDTLKKAPPGYGRLPGKNISQAYGKAPPSDSELAAGQSSVARTRDDVSNDIVRLLKEGRPLERRMNKAIAQKNEALANELKAELSGLREQLVGLRNELSTFPRKDSIS